ncbi:MAG: hypothetical protein ACRDAX_00955 [Propionibacteriaceae bacterium]
MKSMSEKQNILKNLEVKKKKLGEEEKKLSESAIEDKTRVKTITNHIGTMQELVEERVKAIKSLCQSLKLNLEVDFESQSLSSDDLGSSLRQIQHAIHEKEGSLTVQKIEDDQQEDEIQDQIDKVRDEQRWWRQTSQRKREESKL